MQDDNDDDIEPIKDEEVRKDIQVLSSRLYDLRERFMKIVHKINKDSKDYVDETSEEDETTDDESNEEDEEDEMSVNEEDDESTKDSHSHDHNDGDDDEKKTQKFLMKCILESKARRYEYLKNVVKYPKIMAYLLNEDPNCTQISLRHLEPFIKEYVDENPNGKVYDKINQQIQDIRQSYLKNCL